MYNDLEAMFSQYAQDDDYTGGVSIEKVKDVEKELKIILPEEYKWFLSKYGNGGLDNLSVLGVSKSPVAPCIRITKELRSKGLIDNCVVIENCDEWYYCIYLGIDTKEMVYGNIFSWTKRGTIKKEYGTFIDYLSSRINDVAENL